METTRNTSRPVAETLDYRAGLIEALREDPGYAAEYLAEALDTRDEATLRLAVRDVVEALARPQSSLAQQK